MAAQMAAQMAARSLSRRAAIRATGGGLVALAAAGCAQEPAPALPDATDHQDLLAWAIAGAWRLDPERDAWRHPAETLTFWELAPGQTVLELMPGRGWLTAILAPYLARSNGQLIIAHPGFTPETEASRAVEEAFSRKFTADPGLFGAIEQVRLSGLAGEPLAPEGSVDLIICARNFHTLMAAGLENVTLAACFAALKPGGVLAIEQHRAPAQGAQDPQARSGYVQEAYVEAVMREIGFSFVASSDVNANPRDTRDHPFGVWTLPPVLRNAPLGQPPDPAFDTRPYQAIGESDRMTLKFRKPSALWSDPAEETAAEGD